MLAIITLLVLTDPKLALIVGFSLSIILRGFFLFACRYISQIGKKDLKTIIYACDSKRSICAKKKIKIGSLEEKYIERYAIPAKTYAQTTTSNRVLC